MSMLPPHLPISRPARGEAVRSVRAPSSRVEARVPKRAARIGLSGGMRILAREPGSAMLKSRRDGGC